MSDEYVPAGVILQLGTVIMPQRLNSALKLECRSAGHKSRLVRLLFSAGTLFFSHNNSAGTVFSVKFSPANGADQYIASQHVIIVHLFHN